MAAKSTQQTRYRMISIMTFVVLLLSFAYYYFVYVQNNEEAFNNKAFRIIEQASRNMDTTYLINQEVIKNSSLEPDTSASAINGVPIQKIVGNTLPKGFFQKYILFSDHQVFWSDFSTPQNLTISLDTLFKREKGETINLFHATDRLEINFNNQAQLLYFSPVRLSGKTFYIGGILKKSYFRQQAFKLGTNTLIVILMLLALLILSLPFLKFLLLSANERLGTMDAVFSFVVMALGSGFVMLSLLTYYAQSGPSAQHKKELIKTYADSIEDNVIDELDAILKQMDANDKQLCKMVDMGLCGDDPLYCFDRTELSDTIYPYASGTIWMNSAGRQLVKWRPKIITPRVYVGFRKYFRIPNNAANVLWSDNAINMGEGFYIEAIRSITTGKSYAMISKRSTVGKINKLGEKERVAKVISMGSAMQSLAKLSLPSNISYMVIDADGMVMFHQDSRKIMQENLFAETNFNKALREAVYSREDTLFKCNYNEVHSRFYITPVGNLPLFLLVVLDEDHEKMSDAQILSLTVLLYLLLLLLLLLQFGLFVVADYRRKRKVKGFSLFFKWVWPTPAKKKVFVLLSLYLFLSMVVFILGEFYKNVLLSYSFSAF